MRKRINGLLVETSGDNGYFQQQPCDWWQSGDLTAASTVKTQAAPGSKKRLIITVALIQLRGANASNTQTGTLAWTLGSAAKSFILAIGNTRIDGEIVGLTQPIQTDENTAVTFTIAIAGSQTIHYAFGGYTEKL